MVTDVSSNKEADAGTPDDDDSLVTRANAKTLNDDADDRAAFLPTLRADKAVDGAGVVYEHSWILSENYR